jgi:hypothetical protein
VRSRTVVDDEEAHHYHGMPAPPGQDNAYQDVPGRQHLDPRPKPGAGASYFDPSQGAPRKDSLYQDVVSVGGDAQTVPPDYSSPGSLAPPEYSTVDSRRPSEYTPVEGETSQYAALPAGQESSSFGGYAALPGSSSLRRDDPTGAGYHLAASPGSVSSAYEQVPAASASATRTFVRVKWEQVVSNPTYGPLAVARRSLTPEGTAMF